MRMMNLTNMFFKMLSARPNHNHSPGSAPSEKSQQQIARIMFEKNFIAALTGSLADIDLNLPSARGVIKYILRPLRLLSKTAIETNEISSLSIPGVTDEYEISTATSISDTGDMREETRDLCRTRPSKCLRVKWSMTSIAPTTKMTTMTRWMMTRSKWSYGAHRKY